MDCEFKTSLGYTMSVLVGVSSAVKRCHDHGNTYKGETFDWWLTLSEVRPIIIMAGPGGMQADMVLGR